MTATWRRGWEIARVICVQEGVQDLIVPDLVDMVIWQLLMDCC
jgi:hypothetical protein